MQVFACGDEPRENLTADGRLQRGAIRSETVAEGLRRKGTLSLPEYLRSRVRYFCDGAIFGGKEFVEEMFGAHRGRFGPKRQSGARRMKGVDADLFTVRDLQVGVFGCGVGCAGAGIVICVPNCRNDQRLVPSSATRSLVFAARSRQQNRRSVSTTRVVEQPAAAGPGTGRGAAI